MKKRVVCIIFSLVVCLSMSFPASAAVVSKPELAEKIDKAINIILSDSKCPKADYPYYSVFYLKSGTTETVRLFFVKSPVILADTVANNISFYMATVTISSSSPTASFILYENRRLYLNVNSSSQTVQFPNAYCGFTYFIDNRSTAYFYNHYLLGVESVDAIDSHRHVFDFGKTDEKNAAFGAQRRNAEYRNRRL